MTLTHSTEKCMCLPTCDSPRLQKSRRAKKEKLCNLKDFLVVYHLVAHCDIAMLEFRS